MSDVISIGSGWITPTGLALPSDLSMEDWAKVGLHLGRTERSIMWCIGDWWAFGDHRYGNRKAVVTSEDWEGPSHAVCKNAATVCRRFPPAERHVDMTFGHYQEVAYLPSDAARDMLGRAVERRLSTKALRAEVSRSRVTIGSQPSSSTCTPDDLHDLVAAGVTFGCIYADPPWLYDNQGTRASTGNHYSGLTVEQLCDPAVMPISALASDDAHLHMWTTNAFLEASFGIIKAWGFEFRSTFVWAKPQMGIGNYWRNSHEILLTAIRGDAKRFNDHSMMSWLRCERGAHSAKPEQVRDMLERASPGPYLELFGRRQAERWTVWGNQIDRDLFMAARLAA